MFAANSSFVALSELDYRRHEAEVMHDDVSKLVISLNFPLCCEDFEMRRLVQQNIELYPPGRKGKWEWVRSTAAARGG
jgi:hypothetical protein